MTDQLQLAVVAAHPHDKTEPDLRSALVGAVGGLAVAPTGPAAAPTNDAISVARSRPNAGKPTSIQNANRYAFSLDVSGPNSSSNLAACLRLLVALSCAASRARALSSS